MPVFLTNAARHFLQPYLAYRHLGQPSFPKADACSRAAAAAAGEAGDPLALSLPVACCGAGPGAMLLSKGFLAGAVPAVPCLLAILALVTKLFAVLLAACLEEERLPKACCCLALLTIAAALVGLLEDPAA